jgi:tRNA-guanine family transglycosylase
MMPLEQSSWQVRVLDREAGPTRQGLRTPMLWLCHNLRNQVLLAGCEELRRAPVLVSLGDAFLRPSYKDRFFTERLRETLGLQGPIMVDSGGFALMGRRELQWSMKEIKRIYCQLPAEILVSLDHPPSPNDDKVTRRRLRRKTAENLKVMRDFVPAERFMPVIHGHSVREVQNSCDLVRRLCPDIAQVGIGGLVPLICSGGLVRKFFYVKRNGMIGDRGDWMSDVLDIVRQAFPSALVHVFGIGSATTAIGVLALGADSVDSFSWRRVANYGAILLPGRSERFPTLREDRVASRPVIGDADLPLLRQCLCPVCRATPNVRKRLGLLSQCYKLRAVHNAWTVLAEVAEFRKAVQKNQALTFLKSRLSPAHRLYKPVMERWVGSKVSSQGGLEKGS